MGKFKINHDAVKGRNWHYRKTLPWQKNRVRLYIGQDTDKGGKWIRFVTQMSFSRSGKSDIDYVNLSIRADKELIELNDVAWQCHTSYSYKYGSCTYGFSNDLGDLFGVGFLPDPGIAENVEECQKYESAVKAVIGSTTTIIRLSTNSVSNDINVSQGEKDRMEEVLAYYKAL